MRPPSTEQKSAVGWAKRSVPTIDPRIRTCTVGTARETEPDDKHRATRLCPPYDSNALATSGFSLSTNMAHGSVLPQRGAPESCEAMCPRTARGRRECRVKASPMARVQQKSTRQNHRSGRSSGIPCAMVFTIIRALPRDRLSCPCLRQCAFAPCAGLSTGRPGPHDFTSVMRRLSARASACCDAPRPPHPRPTCRDDRAQRPSQRGGMA
jgi:hypothetical protein